MQEPPTRLSRRRRVCETLLLVMLACAPLAGWFSRHDRRQPAEPDLGELREPLDHE
jgi:hypothetical protein